MAKDKKKSPQKVFAISVPGQGIDGLDLCKDKLIEWLDKELEFWIAASSASSSNVTFNNQSHGPAEVHLKANETINGIKKALASDDDTDARTQLKQLLERARNHEVLIGQGLIGEWIGNLVKQGDNLRAAFLLALFAPDWVRRPQINEALWPYRVAIEYNPFVFGYGNVSSSEAALKKASLCESALAGKLKDFDEFVADKHNLIDSLETRYRQELTIEKPAEYWEGVKSTRVKAWRVWFGVFCVLLGLPALAIGLNWATVSAFVVDITKGGSDSGVSLSGLAVISIPTLVYAWLLKHVSRIFLQNLDLAADAAHRKALAVTYLGLVENEKVGLQDQDRALILNALFRPPSTSVADDGPPVGLIDLWRKK